MSEVVQKLASSPGALLRWRRAPYGVLAEIAAAVRDAGVSIESLIQRGAQADGSVLVAIVTHEGPERSVAQALEKLRGSQSLVGEPMWMHILGE